MEKDHQPKPEVCPKDCQGHVTDGVAHTCPPSPASTEEWENEFDEEMRMARFGFGEANELRLKSFIRSLLSSHDQQLRQRIVEGLGKRKKNTDQDSLYATPDNGYDLAIEEAITFITNLK